MESNARWTGNLSTVMNRFCWTTTDNLIADCDWAEDGYTVTSFLSPDENRQVREGIRDIIYTELRAIGVDVPDGHPLEKYHELVGSASDAESPHMQLIARTRDGFPTSEFPIDIKVVCDRISDIIGGAGVDHEYPGGGSGCVLLSNRAARIMR